VAPPSDYSAVIVLLAAAPHELILAEWVHGRDEYVAPTDTAGRPALDGL
jgi:hypothetical protein